MRHHISRNSCYYLNIDVLHVFLNVDVSDLIQMLLIAYYQCITGDNTVQVLTAN